MAQEHSKRNIDLDTQRMPSSGKPDAANGRSRSKRGAINASVTNDSALGEYYPVDYFGDSDNRGESLRDNNWNGGRQPQPLDANHETGRQRGAAQPNHRGRGPKGYKRSDDRIIEDVCERLTEHSGVDASDISVTCKSGIVSLEGTVPDRQMKHRAEDTADGCPGVQDVDNRLKVKATS